MIYIINGAATIGGYDNGRIDESKKLSRLITYSYFEATCHAFVKAISIEETYFVTDFSLS